MTVDLAIPYHCHLTIGQLNIHSSIIVYNYQHIRYVSWILIHALEPTKSMTRSSLGTEPSPSLIFSFAASWPTRSKEQLLCFYTRLVGTIHIVILFFNDTPKVANADVRCPSFHLCCELRVKRYKVEYETLCMVQNYNASRRSNCQYTYKLRPYI